MKITKFFLLYALITGTSLQTLEMEKKEEYKLIYPEVPGTYLIDGREYKPNEPIEIPLTERESLNPTAYYERYVKPLGSNHAEKYWCSKDTTKNTAVAQYRLGYIFYYGRGVRVNSEEAKFWLEKSAAQNHSDGQYLLGLILYDECCHGKGDMITAIHFLVKSAAQNHSDGQYLLGLIIYDECCHGKGDMRTAVNLLVKSALQGNPLAIKKLHEIETELNITTGELSSYFFEKTETLKDDKQLEFGFNESDIKNPSIENQTTPQKEAERLYNLGNKHYEGKVTWDYENARICYEESAKLGHPGAHFMVGAFCHFGIGGPVDEEKALEHYNAADKKDHPFAKRTLKSVKKIPNFGSRRSRG